PAEITYLAATTRLLSMRLGAMPGHLQIVGPPGVGKSWTVILTLALLPEDAVIRIDAGSPRALIYNDRDPRHALLVYSEMDSLPKTVDDPPASAIRNLLQENVLSGDVTEKDPETKQFITRKIRKPGPTTLLTTGIVAIDEPQFASRIFMLEAPEDVKRIRA